MKVLIVDDAVEVCERFAALLKSVEAVSISGFAHSVAQANISIEALRPDVILLDIQMPDGSGIDVLKKAKRQIPSPVVIMVTNYPFPQYRKKCLEAGADYFFDKSN